jgi:hypothetical protein
MVAFAETPFYIPANEHVTIYVSSPIWIKIEVGSRKTFLEEIPTMVLSDTWYGPNTREGELCYASPTFCRSDISEFKFRAHRVITPIVIFNSAKTPLLFERISIPLPFLSIYADVNGFLWTEEIIAKHETHLKLSIKQGKNAPQVAIGATLAASPRAMSKSGTFINLFYSFLSE